MVTQEGEAKLQRQFGELRWTARTKETSASVFLSGRFPPAIQALLEFTDNSAGYRNKDREYPTHIHTIIEPERISVLDYGGLGADGEGIKKFALVGETEDVGISFRGAGAKYAAWFFGEDIEIRAKKRGDDVEYTSSIKGFGDPTIEYAGTFVIDPKKSQWDLDRGRFEVIVRRLKSADQFPQGGANIRRVIGEVYRPLLSSLMVDFRSPVRLENRIILDSNGNIAEVNDKVIMTVTTRKKREQVFPLNIPLLPEYSENDRKILETSLQEKMLVWIGEMDLSNLKSKTVKPGIRFYYDGRLINIDYLGFDEKDPRLSGLTGEVHLDNIIDIKKQLSVNKSAGMNLQSEQWQRVAATLRKFLAPFVEKLQQKTLQTSENRPDYLTSVLSDARRYIDLCLREMAQEGVIITEEDLDLLVGEIRGQRNPPRGKQENSTQRTTRDGKKWIDQKPLTIAPEDASEELPRRRRSFIDGTDLLSLGDFTTVSRIISRARNQRNERILALNSENPTVQGAVSAGKLAMARLAGEELAEHVAIEFRSDMREALQLRDEIRFRHALVLAAGSDYQRQGETQKK